MIRDFSLFQFCNGGNLADYLRREHNLMFAFVVERLCHLGDL